MSKKKTKNLDVVAETSSATNVEVKVPTAEESVENKELVMEANINLTDDKKSEGDKHTPAEEDKLVKSTVTVMNKSQNYICLTASKNCQLTIAPREIKTVSKDLLNELLKNKMVQRFFDKGVLSHNLETDSKVVSAHDAVAPSNLTEAVERHEGGNSVVAQVKKFEKEGSITLE